MDLERHLLAPSFFRNSRFLRIILHNAWQIDAALDHRGAVRVLVGTTSHIWVGHETRDTKGLMLTIALPRGKSLEQRTLDLFEKAHINVHREGDALEFPGNAELNGGAFIKPKRIPLLVAEGDFDIGITGEDLILESGARVEICSRLGYSRSTDDHTRGVLFTSERNTTVRSVRDVPPGSVIFSEYPNLTRHFFQKLAVPVEIVYSPGSAEAEVPRKYPFGVALSETGRSLRENALRILEVLFESRTVLLANPQSMRNPVKRESIKIFQLILQGIEEARGKIFLSMNVPKRALAAVLDHLPALSSPTISPLAAMHTTHEAQSSISSVVPVADINALIPKLLKLGAKGIITMPVSSVVQSWQDC
jgi:ATP phosphoribosyltransferase